MSSLNMPIPARKDRAAWTCYASATCATCFPLWAELSIEVRYDLLRTNNLSRILLDMWVLIEPDWTILSTCGYYGYICEDCSSIVQVLFALFEGFLKWWISHFNHGLQSYVTKSWSSLDSRYFEATMTQRKTIGNDFQYSSYLKHLPFLGHIFWTLEKKNDIHVGKTITNHPLLFPCCYHYMGISGIGLPLVYHVLPTWLCKSVAS